MKKAVLGTHGEGTASTLRSAPDVTFPICRTCSQHARTRPMDPHAEPEETGENGDYQLG